MNVVKSPGEKIIDALYRGDIPHLKYVPAKGKQFMDDLMSGRMNETVSAINKVLS